MTEKENEEALAYLQKRLVRAGVEQALIDAGAVDGDEVEIAGMTFEFSGGMSEDQVVEAMDVGSGASEEPVESVSDVEESRETS